MIARRRHLLALAITAVIVVIGAACGSAADKDLSEDGDVAPPETAVAIAVDSDAPSPDTGSLETAAAEAAPAVAIEAEAQKSVEEARVKTSARTGGEKLAPELTGIDSWINSEPLTIEGSRGQVVLIDFWTYTCINCIRTLPFLREWHAKYADKGLVILGVHSPEFEFEKKRDNVIAAAAEHSLLYAIAQDNSMATWNAFENRFWPAKYLIDKDGYIRYTHFGEGAYDETEEQIRELLAEAGATVSDVLAGSDAGPSVDPAAFSGSALEGLTRELYAGFERNFTALLSDTPPYILQQEFYQVQDEVTLYKDPGDHRNHFMYLHGWWRNGGEKLVHSKATQEYEDYITIKFFAREVNLVMRPENGNDFEVRLTIDGAPLTAEQAGADVRWDSDGNSFVPVDSPRMYHLVQVPEFEGHELKMSSNSTDFALFAFTFGAYETDDGS